mmetsp:Transcript_19300/g.56157  ORF Transcript_19300/g.56157 Transcript_19300/m.56157 type:complete len:911 (-) Transcript_19300:770-3502(-)
MATIENLLSVYGSPDSASSPHKGTVGAVRGEVDQEELGRLQRELLGSDEALSPYQDEDEEEDTPSPLPTRETGGAHVGNGVGGGGGSGSKKAVAGKGRSFSKANGQPKSLSEVPSPSPRDKPAGVKPRTLTRKLSARSSSDSVKSPSGRRNSGFGSSASRFRNPRPVSEGKQQGGEEENGEPTPRSVSTGRTAALHTHAEWKQRKIEELREEELRRHSFTPRTNSSKRLPWTAGRVGPADADGLPAHERLYSHGQKKREKSLTDKLKEVEARRSAEFTRVQRPGMTTFLERRSLQSVDLEDLQGGSLLSRDGDDETSSVSSRQSKSTQRTDALYLESVLRRQRKEAKQRELEKEHSFKPKIRNRPTSKDIGRTTSREDAGSVHDRLYNAGNRKREHAQEVIEQTYAQSRVAKDRRGDFDFANDLDSDIFDDIASPRAASTHTNRTEALYLEASLRQARREEKAAQLDSELRFKPAIKRRTSTGGAGRLARNSTGSESLGGSRHEALYMDSERRRERRLQRESSDSVVFTQNGANGDANEEGGKGKEKRSHTARTDALFLEATLRQARREAKLSQVLQDEASFKPRLKNSRWARNSADNHVVSRLYNPAKQEQAKQERERKKEEWELRAFTGRPARKSTSVVPTQRSDDVSAHERAYSNAQRRAERLERLRADRLSRESEDLTFMPSIKKSTSTRLGPRSTQSSAKPTPRGSLNRAARASSDNPRVIRGGGGQDRLERNSTTVLEQFKARRAGREKLMASGLRRNGSSQSIDLASPSLEEAPTPETAPSQDEATGGDYSAPSMDGGRSASLPPGTEDEESAEPTSATQGNGDADHEETLPFDESQLNALIAGGQTEVGGGEEGDEDDEAGFPEGGDYGAGSESPMAEEEEEPYSGASYEDGDDVFPHERYE